MLRMFRNLLISGMISLSALFIPLEIVGYASSHWIKDLYSDDKAAIIAKLDPLVTNAFAHHKVVLPSLIGWEPPTHASEESGCLNTKTLVTNNPDGIRTYKGYDQAAAQVLLAGDSYLKGAEIDDDQTIGASIFRQTGIITANLGAGGYSPLQSLLYLMKKRPLFPSARVVVLSIMYENIQRLTNSTLGVNAPFSTLDIGSFAQKPYMKNQKIEYIDYSAYYSKEALLTKIDAMLHDDYWEKPDLRFPYSVAFTRALFTPQFQFDIQPPDQKYTYLYNDPYLGGNLLVFASMFRRWALNEDLIPVIIFIPRNLYMPHGPEEWIAHYRSRLPDVDLYVIDGSRIDPARYNRLPMGECHPSPYAAWHIAEQYSAILKRHIVPLKELLYGPLPSAAAPDFEHISVMQIH